MTYLLVSALLTPPRCSLFSSRKNYFGCSSTWSGFSQHRAYQIFGTDHACRLVRISVLRDERGSPHFIGKLHVSYIFLLNLLITTPNFSPKACFTQGVLGFWGIPSNVQLSISTELLCSISKIACLSLNISLNTVVRRFKS